jgi:FMN phosphatase YigB (HAD superfamily)
MIKVIFFDFDGVLTSLPSGTYAVCKYISEKTGKPFEELRKAYLLDVGVRNLGLVDHAEGWKRFWEAAGLEENLPMLDEAFLSAPKEPKMFALAESLKHNGYKLGIITDNTKHRMELLEKEWQLNELFDALIVAARLGVDKYTGGDKIFRLALEKVQALPEETVFIDNNETNIQTAKGIGMAGIFYDSENRDVETLKKDLKKLGVKL